MLKDFITYYQVRGKEELKSIFLTLLAGFLISFGALLLPVITEVAYGEWTQISEVLTWSTIITAGIRSIGGAILYAVWPDRFKFRVTGEK